MSASASCPPGCFHCFITTELAHRENLGRAVDPTHLLNTALNLIAFVIFNAPDVERLIAASDERLRLYIAEYRRGAGLLPFVGAP